MVKYYNCTIWNNACAKGTQNKDSYYIMVLGYWVQLTIASINERLSFAWPSANVNISLTTVFTFILPWNPVTSIGQVTNIHVDFFQIRQICGCFSMALGSDDIVWLTGTMSFCFWTTDTPKKNRIASMDVSVQQISGVSNHSQL